MNKISMKDEGDVFHLSFYIVEIASLSPTPDTESERLHFFTVVLLAPQALASHLSKSSTKGERQREEAHDCKEHMMIDI